MRSQYSTPYSTVLASPRLAPRAPARGLARAALRRSGRAGRLAPASRPHAHRARSRPPCSGARHGGQSSEAPGKARSGQAASDVERLYQELKASLLARSGGGHLSADLMERNLTLIQHMRRCAEASWKARRRLERWFRHFDQTSASDRMAVSPAASEEPAPLPEPSPHARHKEHGACPLTTPLAMVREVEVEPRLPWSARSPAVAAIRRRRAPDRRRGPDYCLHAGAHMGRGRADLVRRRSARPP